MNEPGPSVHGLKPPAAPAKPASAGCGRVGGVGATGGIKRGRWSRLAAVLLVFVSIAVIAAPSEARETHRLRIGNRKGAAIEVSLDGGRNWTTIGRVVKPATDTGAGFAALAQASSGAVAAINRDAITIRTDRPAPGAAPKPRIFSVQSAGGAGGDAAIGTDLPRGTALFGPLTPPLGSEARLESARGGTRPLPGGYIPQPGDHLVIVASVPADAPAMLLFENKEGGRILAVSPTGDESVVGRVKRPLRGVARYPATDGATCGAVVSHHPAALVVATTPALSTTGTRTAAQTVSLAAQGQDHRFAAEPPSGQRPLFGGFLIQPEASAVALKAEEGSVLVVDRLTAAGPALGLPLSLSPTGGSLIGQTRVEARLDGGAWEPLPAIGGAEPAALTAVALTERFAAQGTPRSLEEGITHLRLVLAPPSPERLRAALEQAVPPEPRAGTTTAPPRRAAPRSGTAPGKGPAAGRARKATKTLRVVARIQGQGIAYVMFYVDGRLRKMTNRPPFEWLWNTRSETNGPHTLEIRGADADGRIITTQTQQVTVYN